MYSPIFTISLIFSKKETDTQQFYQKVQHAKLVVLEPLWDAFPYVAS